MKHRRIPSYRLHRATGQAVVTLAGKDHYLGKYETPASREAYDQLIARWLVEGRQAAPVAYSPLPPAAAATTTVNELILRFLEYATGYYPREGRELAQFKFTLRPLRHVCGSLTLAEFGPRALKAVQRQMVALGWSRKVINRRVTRIRTMFKWGESEELVPPGTTHALATVRGLRRGELGVRDTAPIKPALWEDVQKVLPFCSRVIAAMVQLQFLTGMRSCEVRLLRSGDIDRQKPGCWLYRPKQHKNAWRDSGQERVIPLGPECQKVLADWLQPRSPGRYVFQPKQYRPRRSDITSSQAAVRPKSGQPSKRPPAQYCYSANTYAQAVARACQRAGVHFRPYALRHGRKMMIERLAGAEGARTVLGQKSIQATQHYGRLDLDRAIAIMAQYG